ncbi:MAG: LD-carboxypeptidase [Bacteroidetes bacterium]|jgi:muramoyltetrapeptide carboxypeptidase|nr:LD-carboxypeptidase [Bacteroidota bacterium]
MIFPPLLKSGDTVALIATARSVTRQGMEPAIRLLTSWGLQVAESSDLYASDNQFAGTDRQRAAGLQQALDDDNIKAILFARGGYGTVRIIDALDFTRFRKKPKWLIGFSDITVLHSHINQNTGIATLHAPLALTLPDAPESVQKQLYSILFSGIISTQQIEAHTLNRPGETTAELVGGNLSVLVSLGGSVSMLNTDEKILFIEDIGEYRYHLDRMMMFLKRSNKLQHLKGLIVGAMTDITDYSGYPVPFGKDAYEIIASHVEEFNYPVCYGFPAGHISGNYPLITGGTYRLCVNATHVELSANISV